MFNISVLLKFVVILPMNFFFVWIYNSNDCVIAVCEWVKFLLTGSFRSSSYCQWFHIKFTGKTNGAFFINVKIRPFSFNQNTLPPLLAPTTLILKSVNWNFDVKKRIFLGGIHFLRRRPRGRGISQISTLLNRTI